MTGVPRTSSRPPPCLVPTAVTPNCVQIKSLGCGAKGWSFVDCNWGGGGSSQGGGFLGVSEEVPMVFRAL